jgi:hypothetical protein
MRISEQLWAGFAGTVSDRPVSLWFELQRHLDFRPMLFEILQIIDKRTFPHGGHFYEGRLLQEIFIQGRNLEDDFSKDQNLGTLLT